MSPRPISVQTWPKERTGWIRTSSTTAIPTRFGAAISDPAQPFDLELEVVTRGGRRPEVTDLIISARQPGGNPVTTESLRRIHLASALKLVLTRATQKVIDNGDDTFSFPDDTSGAAWGGPQVSRPIRGTPMTEDFMMLVAETYRAAVASGSRSPVEDLRRELGASRSTAGRWIVAARKAGHLRQAVGRTAGEIPPEPSKRRGKSK
jgi:hypothetical protein